MNIKHLYPIALIIIVVAISLYNLPNLINQEQPATNNVLDLSNKNLSEFPKEVLSMDQLEELNLSNNQLTGAIPAEIKQLKNLKKLNLSHNLMTGLPAELGQLSQLEELDVSYNDLTGLPHELDNLKNLKILNLAGNDYSKIDLEIITKNLSDLQVIE